MSLKTGSEIVANLNRDKYEVFDIVIDTEKEVYEKIKDIVHPEDFIDDVYIKLAQYVYEKCENKNEVHPADAVNIFTEPQEQKKAAETFALKLNFENMSDMEKAVNEEVRLIKRTKNDILASTASSLEDLTKVINEKKKLESIYIEL